MEKAKLFTETATSRIPGMLSQAELAFCRYAAKEAGGGLVVELGPWLGSSTLKLIEGIREAGGGRLVSFDRFAWSGPGTYMAKSCNLGLAKGACFQHKFKQNVMPGLPAEVKLEVRKADLCTVVWNRSQRQEIKFLFCDALKTWPATSNALRQFLPGLAVGGIVADQDWMWAVAQNNYYHLAFWWLMSEGYLEPAYTLGKEGHLRAFRCRLKITPEVVETAIDWKRYTIEDIELMIPEFRIMGIYPMEDQTEAALRALAGSPDSSEEIEDE